MSRLIKVCGVISIVGITSLIILTIISIIFPERIVPENTGWIVWVITLTMLSVLVIVITPQNNKPFIITYCFDNHHSTETTYKILENILKVSACISVHHDQLNNKGILKFNRVLTHNECVSIGSTLAIYECHALINSIGNSNKEVKS